MVKKPVAPGDPNADLSKEAMQRVDACEKQKLEFELDIRESYFFAAPHRARQVQSRTPTPQPATPPSPPSSPATA